MIIEGKLIPFFRHLQKVVATQLVTDNPGMALDCDPEIAGKPKLFLLVPMSPYQFFHDLEKHSRGILGERPAGRVQHLITQGSECGQPLINATRFQGFQEIDDRKGNSKPSGFGHLFNAAGMEVGIGQFPGAGVGIILVEDVIDDAQ